MQGSRGGFSGGGSGRVPDTPAGIGGMTSGRHDVEIVGSPSGMSGSRYPGSAQLPGTGGMGGMGMGGWPHPPGSSTADDPHPEGRSSSAASAALPDPADRSRRRRRCRHACPGAAVRPPPNVVAVAAVAAAAAVSRRPRNRAAAHQLGPLCAERGGGRGRVHRLAAGHRRAAAPASPDAARNREPAILQHVDPPPADQRPAPGARGGARAGRRGIYGPAEPDRDAAGSRDRQCRRPRSSNMRSPACGCRRRTRSPPGNAC